MKLKLYNVTHEFAAPADSEKPIFLPFGKWPYDEKVSQSLDREHAERIANELNARVGRGEPGIPAGSRRPPNSRPTAAFPPSSTRAGTRRSVRKGTADSASRSTERGGRT